MALPARKSSNAPVYVARSSRFPMIRRSRIQAIFICVVALSAVLFIFSRIFGGSDRIPTGTPPVVIVTVVDPGAYSKEYIQNIKENRIEYAKKHGEWGSGYLSGRVLTVYRICEFFPNSHGL